MACFYCWIFRISRNINIRLLLIDFPPKNLGLRYWSLFDVVWEWFCGYYLLRWVDPAWCDYFLVRGNTEIQLPSEFCPLKSNTEEGPPQGSNWLGLNFRLPSPELWKKQFLLIHPVYSIFVIAFWAIRYWLRNLLVLQNLGNCDSILLQLTLYKRQIASLHICNFLFYLLTQQVTVYGFYFIQCSVLKNMSICNDYNRLINIYTNHFNDIAYGLLTGCCTSKR